KRAYCLKTQPATGETYPKSDLFNKAAYCLKTQPATGETYPKSDLFNKASEPMRRSVRTSFSEFSLYLEKVLVTVVI
ncbi:hypothetical protein M8R92_02565, partial [Enterobacter hormaechei]|nr:hypothetical protein [Enterobacter hormaechei]